MHGPIYCTNFRFPWYIFVKAPQMCHNFKFHLCQLQVCPRFAQDFYLLLAQLWHLKLSHYLVQNQFLRQWKQMTQFLKLQCCLELPDLLHQQNWNWCFLSMHSCSKFLDIFPEREHSPLLFVADWYRFNLSYDFDTSRSDLYVKMMVHNQDDLVSSSPASLNGKAEIKLKI